MARYTLYINFKEITAEYPLPAVNNRNVIIDMSSVISGCRLSFEVYDNIWSIKKNDFVSIEFDGQSVESHTLSGGDLIRARLAYGEKFVIMVYKVTPFITQFTKYNIKSLDKFTMGKSENCNIRVSDKFISGEHALFSWNGDKWIITDKSSNGTYINGSRINGSLELKMYDIIYTVGFKMVYLGDILALNRSDIVSCNLPLMIYDDSTISSASLSSEMFFSRSPRVMEPLFDEVTEIEGPPAPQKPRNQSLIFVVGPSVTMPLPILMATVVNTQGGGTFRWGTLVSVGVSAVIGAGWAIAHYLYNKKVLKADEMLRVEAYNDYIKKNENLLAEKHNYNSSILQTQFLSSEDIIAKMSEDNSFIWNRNINHDDFLSVRIGTGTVKFKGNISVPKQRFSVHKDDMSELPHKVKEQYEFMRNSVAVLELAKNKIIGMIGSTKLINETARNIIIQTAALHCYTDVRIAFLFTEEEEREFGWVRWLPHTYGDDMKLRMVADNSLSYQNVLYHINGILRARTEALRENDGEAKRLLPHYLVFCTSETIFEGDGIEKYISMSEALGFTFILMYKKFDRLPNECKMIVECGNDFTGIYSIENKRGETDRVKFDRITREQADKFARQISKLHVRQYSEGEIPSSIEYFDMIGIGRLEQWDLIKKYKENRVFEGIRSFVGIGTGGKPVYIDIHEKKYGPHGLVAGTTGSGKSETLQTFIISLALNYHPDEVAFILIDYKGGGMANAFIGMPHVAGTITNLGGEDSGSGELDANLTRRALVSIKSEIKRRQAIFNKYKVNHIDMYIRMYRENKTEEPLPHLIIISDEFAELKKEQPEFIKELVSTARVGRSLGIHLILATQKPGGVVDDEIWSNSRFKLCLRVQDKQDSMGMLKRPEAAYLTQTGRAYLQIGNDEIFEQFQTGYSGAEYQPKDNTNAASDSDIEMINIDGTPSIIREKIKSKKSGVSSQLEAAVRYISEVCGKNGISATRALWLPALGTDIALDEITEKYKTAGTGISAVFGFVDDPEKQRQFPAVIDLAACSNLIISGISGIGKTTLLQTLLVSLMKNYTCEQVTFYILDFGGRTLKMFGKAPHCGLAAFSDDSEAVTRLFKFVDKNIGIRKNLFNEANVGSYSEYAKNHSMPLMLVIIDNYFSFSELYQNLQDDFMRITRDCAKYGIQIIVTCNHFNDIRYKLKQNFVNSLTLVMAEKGDYREAWGISPEFAPENKKGRGMILSDGRLLEFQTLLPVRGDSESDRNTIILNLIGEVYERDRNLKSAEKVAVLPKEQTYTEFMENNYSVKSAPVGYITSDISVYALDLEKTYCYAVSENGSKGTALVMNNLISYAKAIGAEVHAVRLKTAVKLDREQIDKTYTDREAVTELLIYLKSNFKERSSDKKAFLAENPDSNFAEYICGKYGKIFVFIDSMSEFTNMIYDSTNAENMYSITETFFKQGMGLGIYFIAGFDPEMYGQNFYSVACRNFISYKCGIHLGGCYDKQKLFDVSMPISQMSKPLDYFIGYTSEDGIGSSIFIPHHTTEM